MIRTCRDFEGKVEVLPFPADVTKELKRFAGIQDWGYIGTARTSA